VQLPLHFQTFPTTPPRARQEAPKVRRAAIFAGVSAFQMGLIHIIAGMMGAGVFERYPRLRVSFGESGAGWLAHALHRMDFEFEDRFRDLMKLKPSEYWRRQCKATLQFDPISAKLIDDIGVETMMWGSDYPHTDHLAGILEIHQGAVRRTLARCGVQDHPRKRRPILPVGQLTGCPLPHPLAGSRGGNGRRHPKSASVAEP
jgi:predicted TIM-barrel fold metal-dependent hydrolase